MRRIECEEGEMWIGDWKRGERKKEKGREQRRRKKKEERFLPCPTLPAPWPSTKYPLMKVFHRHFAQEVIKNMVSYSSFDGTAMVLSVSPRLQTALWTQ